MKTLEMIRLKIKRLPHSIKDPSYATEGSAGMDICAAVEKPVCIKPMERFAVPTGLIFEVPEGYEAQIRARSGLSIKHGLCLANGVGTVDSDYRGEVKVLMINLGDKTFTINPGDRIAQVIINQVIKAHLEVSEELTDTERSTGGFGSTGI
ncbi:MAG: dUTP diphosphatase [Cyanobacteriota bacterium]